VTHAFINPRLADAVVDLKFVLPYETEMAMGYFIDQLQVTDEKVRNDDWTSGQTASPSPAYYIQSQNNNLNSSFQELLEDIPNEIDFASEALGKSPDAVNFWMGNSQSTTSLHRDPYENIYHMVAGTKTFIL
jgi:jumonji domain-containing protein 7